MCTVSPVPTQDAQREAIVGATAELLRRNGAAGLNVKAIMAEAGVSRTAFYRRFETAHDAVVALLDRLLDLMADANDDWLAGKVIGHPDIVEPNLAHGGAVLAPHAPLICAIVDAAGTDHHLREAWRSRVVQARIDTTEAAIRRDQAAGAVRATLDPAATAHALTLMNEALVLDILGRRGGTPEEFARIAAPVWIHVLFTDDTAPHG
jgi:AcrR family transcriptional regulator